MPTTLTPPLTITITVIGPGGLTKTEVLAVVLPADFALTEELIVASATKPTDAQRARIGAAMIGTCCPVLTRMLALAGIDYATHEFAPLAYGRAVYGWLHGQGVKKSELIAAFYLLQSALLAHGWPRKDEVDAALGKSEASAAPATA